MAIGLGASLNTVRDVKLARAVTSGLVLKSNFDTGAVTPISDGSASFDGTDDYIIADMPSAFSGIAANSFNCTMSAWAKFDSIGIYDAIICMGTFDIEIAPTTSTAVGIYINNAAYGGAVYTPTMGEWNHYAMTKNGNDYIFYVNGALHGTGTDSDNVTVGTDFFIGRNGHTDYMNGNICNVGMWTSALTAAQIKSIMYKNYSGLTSSETTNLVSWWNLDEAVDSNNLHVADLVNDTLGATALTNGDFATGDFTGWTAGGPPAGAEVVSHDGHKTAAHITTSSNDHGYNQNTLTAGQVYKVSFDIKVISGSIYLGKDGTQVGGVDYTDSSWTSYTHYWTAPDTYFRIYSEIASSEFYIDNISVQPTNGNYGTLS